MRVAGIVLMLGLLALASPAGAAETFTVTTTRDGVDQDGGDGECLSPRGGCPLRAAISQANATPGDDDIVLPAGVFQLTRPRGPAASNSGGDLYITEEVRIEGEGRTRT